ncbi:Aste57867_10873 [Aphanomyces stellatus]|uniref:Aste57867_10873 protein n=1 Tax=Aphanomyces stellatus TaxID=120398 RepID=A0A485KRL8_9STRA|nr:hypothetical protein As57867_010833 [Aphanomyces stellatus]VFT87741.1 Aste57867_10873 [Aphanomyces stellatus]
MGNANGKEKHRHGRGSHAASSGTTQAPSERPRSASDGTLSNSGDGDLLSSQSRTASNPPRPSTQSAQRTSDAPPSSSTRSSTRSSGRRSATSRRSAVQAGGIERGQEAVEDATQQSYWHMVRNGYEQMVNLFIRPPRAQYEVSELGPTTFNFCGRNFERTDFEVPVLRKPSKVPLQIRCSHWHPSAADRPAAALPCLIYLHGNSSCRLEALSILRCVLTTGATVVAIDCIGCGLSDGEYITLGYYERDDVHAVIDYLRRTESVSAVALWGRSMGAVTALLHADRDPSIAGIIVDSAFASLDMLVHEVVEHGRREGYTIPTLAVKIVMRFIRSSVWKRAHFELRELSPIDHVDKSFIPALFVAAHKDSFIRPHHSDALFAKYAGDKNLIKVQGDHNSVRPQYLLESIGIFLQTVMCITDETWQLHDPFATSSLPWSQEAQMLTRLFAASLESHEFESLPQQAWACPLCTFINPAHTANCALCESPFDAPLHQVEDDKGDDEDEEDGVTEAVNDTTATRPDEIELVEGQDQAPDKQAPPTVLEF